MRQVLAWALFDLANTFFAVAMVSFYFPLWIVEDLGAPELVVSVALGASMVCVAALMPFCGAISDAAGERMRYLRFTVYGCVAATIAIGCLSHLGAALVLFGLANICYQLGTVFYDALLWRVAPAGRLGQVSGLGAAFGYVGSMLGLLLLWPFVRVGGHQAAFIPAGVFFLLFALPSFFMIRESPAGTRPPLREVARSAWLRLAMTVRSARSYPGLWRFFWASFFSLNAINTVLVFMVIYTKRTAGFSEAQIIQFFLVGQAAAVAGSLTFGRVLGRWGARRTLGWIWAGWAAALAVLAIDLSVRWMWVAGPVIGFCLGSTWATSRVLIVELSPKDQLAEMFGLAGLFARASSVLGPIAWGLLAGADGGHRRALVVMVGLLAVGILLLRRVPEPRAA